MHLYTNENGLVKHQNTYLKDCIPENTIWIDLLKITSEEKTILENNFQIDIPDFNDINNLCLSSNMYKKDNAIYLTIIFYLSKTNNFINLEPYTVTFILTKKVLITLRDSDCLLFSNFLAQLEIMNNAEENIRLSLLTEFIGNIVNDTAAILEQIAHKLNNQNEIIISPSLKISETNYKIIIKEIVNIGEMVSKTQETLISLNRMISFLFQAKSLNNEVEFNNDLRTLLKDINALNDHASFLSSKLNFTLDAIMGLINIEQNIIIKILSIASVLFLPPTLIASIFGMNFKFMPELDLSFGYPLSLIYMIGSAILSLWYFKTKNWL